MNDFERLKLQEMIKTNDVEDQTNKIRKLKHSEKIKSDVEKMKKLKTQETHVNLRSRCQTECYFLFSNYTDIFNKLIKDEIDVTLLETFISILKKIELGEIDQHEGSYQVGKVLKNIYIDSALKRSSNLSTEEEPVEKRVSKVITWRDYKKMNS
tara:strand:- start:2907 stop:3368 length:462 start_codon:yes stop_codon:yes gene_type:complete